MDGFTLAHEVPTRKDFIDTADFDQSEMLDIIRTARTVREFIKEGYSIKLIPHSEYLEPNGILTKLPKSVKGIKYTIETTKDDVVERNVV